MSPTVHSLYRYPVKGLSPEPLTRVGLTQADYFPGDRLFAIENGPAGFDPAAPAHQSKIKFLMLMRNARLATLRTRYDDASGRLIIHAEGPEAVSADISSADGRLAVEAFFRRFIPKELRGRPKVLTAPQGFRFTDSRRGYVSIINLASVAALETAIGAPVHPLRFRANIYLTGWPAWHEFDLVGHEIKIAAAARLKITKRIQRCAAIDVDPDTGIRDLSIPRTLLRTFGHIDCGVYAEVIASGAVTLGDTLAELETRQHRMVF
jgi:uncharacterized protein YcbX